MIYQVLSKESMGEESKEKNLKASNHLQRLLDVECGSDNDFAGSCGCGGNCNCGCSSNNNQKKNKEENGKDFENPYTGSQSDYEFADFFEFELLDNDMKNLFDDSFGYKENPDEYASDLLEMAQDEDITKYIHKDKNGEIVYKDMCEYTMIPDCDVEDNENIVNQSGS